MKILAFSTFYYPHEVGGAEKSTRLVLEALSQKGHECHVVTLGNTNEQHEYRDVQIKRTKIDNIYLPTGRGEKRNWIAKALWHAIDSWNPITFYKVKKLIETIRPDIVYTNNISGFSPSIWSACKTTGTPFVHTPRDFYLLCINSTMTRTGCQCTSQCISCRILTTIKRKQSNHIDHIAAISDFTVDTHRAANSLTASKSLTVYNPVEIENKHQSSECANHELLKIGYIGRLDRTKGLEELIAAVKTMSSTHATKLAIAGSGDPEYTEKIKQMCLGFEKTISIIGHQKPADFFPNIDILVVPSTWNEPLGRVVIEAFSYGKPVVATHVGGIPEVAQGLAAITISDNSPQAIIRGVAEMQERIHNHSENVRNAAHEEAQKYSTQRVANNIEQYFNSIVLSSNTQ